jgi:uncharacterized protein (DUF58 family)
MTLSLLLSSLVLSGILSWINFRKLAWILQVPEHLQAGEVGMVAITVDNRKQIFPTMSIAFEVESAVHTEPSRLHLNQTLGAGERAVLEWTFVPERRGRFRVTLLGVESKFPFGFLLKGLTIAEERELLVWPARVDYAFQPASAGRRFQTGMSRNLAGAGSDLLNLRRYERGDPPRLIHWKATARMNTLMIRQLAQEGESGFHLYVDPDTARWGSAQLERLCSVARALAEDLFQGGRLQSVQLAGHAAIAVRGLRELHDFFDQLAALEPVSNCVGNSERRLSQLRNFITFKPLGEGDVAIYVNDTQAGQA